MKKYNFIVTENALLDCDKGISCGTFRSLSPETSGMKIEDHSVAVSIDTDITGFGFCSQTRELCNCLPEKQWSNVCSSLLVDGHPVITRQSFLPCKAGGIISVKDAGQECTFEENGCIKWLM